MTTKHTPTVTLRPTTVQFDVSGSRPRSLSVTLVSIEAAEKLDRRFSNEVGGKVELVNGKAELVSGEAELVTTGIYQKIKI